jgi:type IV pilus assembly protein PilW
MRSNSGFTLIEIMVATAISLVVMGSIYSVYQTQQKSYIVQEQVAAMQQNLRAGMTMLTRDIRMAGYDPTGANNLGITAATSNNITFQRRDDADTVTQTITYTLADYGGDGDTDLFRDDGGGPMLVAENINALDFVYLNASGGVIATPGTDPAATSAISAIQVTMVAKTGRGDRGYVNTGVYSNQQPGPPIYTAPGDNNRRIALTREVKRRNTK